MFHDKCGAGARRAWIVAALLPGLGCRTPIAVPRLDSLPLVDDSRRDWEQQPRQVLAKGDLQLALARDGQRICLLLEGRDPALARALAQGRVELRIGGPDERGRLRSLRVERDPGAFPGVEPGGAAARRENPPGAGQTRLEPQGPDPRTLRWLWVLAGEDYQDERRLPLSSAPSPLAELSWDAVGWFLEMELPLERLSSLRDQPEALDLELVISAVRVGARPGAAGGAEPGGRPGGPAGAPGRGHGAGPGQGPGGMGGGPGGMGGGPGGMGGGGGGMGGGPGGETRPQAASPGSGPVRQAEPGLSGLPVKIRLSLKN